MIKRRRVFESFSEIIDELREEVERLSSLLEDLESPMWNATECCLTPLSSVKDLGDEYEVTVDLPLVDQGTINVYVEGNDTLKIEAGIREKVKFEHWGTIQRTTEFRRYKKIIRFPEPVDPTSLRVSFKQGLLIAKVKKV
ncbi:MAG: Hsp20/alpha crystallin family protein [Candidatus Nezhaarchaeota archaeon]|nr:Hsp20/alpha crystallin family protein [Candidatus Nezhaarchaeota archaeon]MCX8142256.1 Hsp20/alpha crystallin family protein [Candidatus Nezhaarchaeota archaeon]MDW8050771.1 Hsp20/alpha crystallin family protein [Nitrososphaerota archaeon]